MSAKSLASRETPFLQAAHAFDAALTGFQRAVEAAQRAPLNSARNLERAAQSLDQVAQAEKGLNAAAQVLGSALNQTREQQLQHMQQLSERSQQIAVRGAQFQKLMEGYRALGAAAGGLNSETAELARKRKELGAQPAGSDFTADIQALQEKMTLVAQTAQTLQEAARSNDFEDIARQVDAVRQQLLSARSKLSMFGR